MHTRQVISRLPPGLIDGPVWTSAGTHLGPLERVVPTGGAQIVFDLDSGRGVLVGLRTASAVVRPPLRARGMRLTGAGVYSIVGPDAGCVVDQAIDLDAIAASGVLRRLRDRGVQHDDLVEAIAALCSRFVPDPRVVSAEQALRRGVTGRDASRVALMDRREFVPLFRRQVGLNPKRYERLVRFASATAALREGSDRPIAAIAIDHDYADQAHLTREVRELAETTPRALALLPAGPATHLPVDGRAR